MLIFGKQRIRNSDVNMFKAPITVNLHKMLMNYCI